MAPVRGEDVVREVVQRWNRGERKADQRLFDPDLEIHSELTSGTWRGYEGLATWARDVDERFGVWKLEVAEVSEAGPDRLLVVGTTTLRPRGGGEVRRPTAWLVRFRDDRVAELDISFDVEAARRAAAGG